MKPPRIVLIEDEAVTARQLAYLLQKINEQIQIVAILSSVAEAVQWLRNNDGGYDLMFMDIRLADGSSFGIFRQVVLKKPVVFVTAYNDYAIQAFKNNGIDYILKPFDQSEIAQSLQKYQDFFAPLHDQANVLQAVQLPEQVVQLPRAYRKTLLVHYREKLIPLETRKIAWLYTANEIVYARMTDDHQHIIDFTMGQLEQQLDPQHFFRANRQFLIHREAIEDASFYFNGRLLVNLHPAPTAKVLISKARAAEFKAWMDS
jgi:DNA-binding LytR/AlgR family response regulator